MKFVYIKCFNYNVRQTNQNPCYERIIKNFIKAATMALGLIEKKALIAIY